MIDSSLLRISAGCVGVAFYRVVQVLMDARYLTAYSSVTYAPSSLVILMERCGVATSYGLDSSGFEFR
jgi:hypothetical protein